MITHDIRKVAASQHSAELRGQTYLHSINWHRFYGVYISTCPPSVKVFNHRLHILNASVNVAAFILPLSTFFCLFSHIISWHVSALPRFEEFYHLCPLFPYFELLVWTCWEIVLRFFYPDKWFITCMIPQLRKTPFTSAWYIHIFIWTQMGEKKLFSKTSKTFNLQGEMPEFLLLKLFYLTDRLGI